MNPQEEYTNRKPHKATYRKTMKASDKEKIIKAAGGGGGKDTL